MTPKQLAAELRELFKEANEPNDITETMAVNREIYFNKIKPHREMILAALEAYEPGKTDDMAYAEGFNDGLDYALEPKAPMSEEEFSAILSPAAPKEDK